MTMSGYAVNRAAELMIQQPMAFAGTSCTPWVAENLITRGRDSRIQERAASSSWRILTATAWPTAAIFMRDRLPSALAVGSTACQWRPSDLLSSDRI
jgi:hypothetical protein